jgi:CRISPR system Cascade subunit CasE
MMYLSRLLLNARSRQVQREVTDPYQRHRTILSAFPDQLPAGERVLHRLEYRAPTGALTLLVQSTGRPDWARLAGYDYLQPALPLDGAENPAVKRVDLRLKSGQLLWFRLVANPTVKKQRDGHRNGNRVPLVREERQMEWLRRKGEQHGFRLIDVAAGIQTHLQGWKRKGMPALTLFTVQFDGRLQVTDVEAFMEALQSGIGPAKAFGCGLLSLAPG